MGSADLQPVLPALGILATAIAVLGADLFVKGPRSRAVAEWIAYVGIVGAFLGVFLTVNKPDVAVFSGALTVDKLSRFTSLSVLAATLLTCLLSVEYIRARQAPVAEFLALVLISASGMMFLSMASDLITMFLCIEIMSIAIYVLCGIVRADPRSNEAAVKYFVQGAFATAILLYGMALLYGATGSVFLPEMARSLSAGASPLAAAGVALVIAGFAFKVGAAPFHYWVPDVYEGSPTAVTAFMSVSVKAAGFAALIRLLVAGLESSAATWTAVLWAVAALTMIAGNLGAVAQTSVKRMLAYSSVAHTGYALAGLASYGGGDPGAATASALFYFFVYTFMTLGAFAFLIQAGREGRDAETYDDLAGLAKRRPWAALVMTVFMVSLAGIPPTAGFFGKFMVFKAAVVNGEIGLAVLGVLTSVIGVAYYLRVVVAMYMRDPKEEAAAGAAPKGDLNVDVAVAVAALLTVVFGLMPADYLSMARQAVESLLKFR